jgi:hypothetical protein
VAGAVRSIVGCGLPVSGAVVKRIDEIGNGTAIVPATRFLPIAADLAPSLPISLPIRAPCHSPRCVAGPSLHDAIPQHLLRYFFQMRMACNKAWGGRGLGLIRLLTATSDNSGPAGSTARLLFLDGSAPAQGQ